MVLNVRIRKRNAILDSCRAQVRPHLRLRVVPFAIVVANAEPGDTKRVCDFGHQANVCLPILDQFERLHDVSLVPLRGQRPNIPTSRSPLLRAASSGRTATRPGPDGYGRLKVGRHTKRPEAVRGTCQAPNIADIDVCYEVATVRRDQFLSAELLHELPQGTDCRRVQVGLRLLQLPPDDADRDRGGRSEERPARMSCPCCFRQSVP